MFQTGGASWQVPVRLPPSVGGKLGGFGSRKLFSSLGFGVSAFGFGVSALGLGASALGFRV